MILSPPTEAPAADASPSAPRREGGLNRTVERLRTILVDSGAAAAWEWLIPEKLFVGDAGFAALYGLLPEQAASGVSSGVFFSIIHPLDRDRMRLALGGVARGAELLSKDYRILPVTGQGARWVHLRGRSEFDADGRAIRFSGALVDITEQKRLEEQLRIAQDAGGVGTFEHTLGFGTVAVSPKFCALLGLHPTGSLPVRTVNAAVMPGDPPIVDLATMRPAGSVREAEFRVRVPGDQPRWLMRRCEYVNDTETTGIRISGVIYDITAAKRTEAQLRLLNDTLEQRVAERTRERDQIWRVSEDLLGVADANGAWLSINPAWHKLLGWRDADIIGRTTGWLEGGGGPEPISAAMVGLADGARLSGFENRLQAADGSYRWLAWTAVREGGAFYCVGRDITHTKAAAAMLAHTEEQLRQSQKMEAVGQLTGGMAHDFNNLLTAIYGSLEMVTARIGDGRAAESLRYAEAAQSACKRAAALTHRLLAFSRRQTLTPQPTDIRRLALDLEDLLRRTIGPEISLRIQVAADAWTTLVDPNQLENALLNLCINARDAMPDGGTVTIDVANRVVTEAETAEFDLAAGEYLGVTVTDTGTGMPPDVVAHAFEPFFTTKPLGQGTGLGLSMIYGFARQSGGQARIRSKMGQGTAVSLYLPRGDAAVIGDAVPDDGRTGVQAIPGETVLVVDDEPVIRMLVAEVLEELGYSVLEAEDGASAFKVLQTDVTLNLMVADVGLPGGMNGRQLADYARKLRPGLKVLFITGYAEQSVLGGAHLEQGMDVVTKPFSLEVLAGRIQRLVGA